ncbi:MAG: T9SS type A sorting domain-containing protein, partial [Candidatus Methylacidiphilales bacterium]
KIILTPTTLPELIENVTLDVTVKDVYDLNGNKMQSPKTWIAYVDKNQVKWQDQEFEFNKKAGEALSFTTNIVNSGGAIKQYNIQNLPVWLTANFPSGTISPNSFKTITFTIDPNVNIGNYENEVQLLTDFGYPDGLLIKLKVFSVVPSTWTVNPGNFQNSMSIVGQIRINNVISTNPDDKLAVFVDGVCRGICGLQYYPQIDRYYAFLNVFSNVSQGETLEFKIWNAGEGKIHSDVTPKIQFLTNGQIGTISNPQVFNASDKLTRYIPLATGWNWISFNLNMKDSSDINKLFRGITSGNGDIFRSQTKFADYSVLNGWAGSIANPMVGVKPEISYRLRSSVVDTLAITGVEIDPTTRPIRIDSGWNWLGFVSQRNLSISEAFSSLTATSGDLIKSQNQFALYDVNIGWVGSLTALIPNKGYMYRAGAAGNFAYPKSAMFGKNTIDINTYNSNYFKFDATKFEKNMSAVIDAGVCNNALSNGRLSLGAYSNGELRGVTKVSTLDNGKNIYFLNISSNTDNENISFKLLDELNGKTYELLGDINFNANKLVGSIPSPFALKTSGSFNCNDFNTSLSNGLNVFVYPNPFSSNIVLNIQGINASKVQVQIVDITGKAVDNFEQLTLGNNAINIDWNPSDRGITLKQGAYFIEVLAGDQVVRAKVLKF